MKWSWLLVVALAACTKPNPAVCCLDEADCNAAGLSSVRECSTGLACVEHECVVPSCSTTGCGTAAPVCNIRADVCEGCTESAQCSRFADTDICDIDSGACVECTNDAECPPAEPVCDANACRRCKLDEECASGACADDGSCVGDAAIVFLDPDGVDTGTCTRTSPCRSIEYAATRTSDTRNHLVFVPGTYVEYATVNSGLTAATKLYFHGHGASLVAPPGDSTVLGLSIASTVRDLNITAQPGGEGINLSAEAFILERIKVRQATAGIHLLGPATLIDIEIEDTFRGIVLSGGGQLHLDRAVIRGGTNGIAAISPNTSVDIVNLLVYGTSERALELANASGTIVFSTIADSGADSGMGPRAVDCSKSIIMRSSIVWAPGFAARAPIAGCKLVSTIAGPISVQGGTNANPQFIDSENRNYHLAPTSPAVDAVDAGPALDFEGNPRPSGARFDIGADEAAP